MPRPNQYDDFGNPSSDATRLQPPAGLPDEVEAVFRLIVSACDPAHFAPAESPLLVEYCYVLARCARAEAAIRIEGEVIQTPRGDVRANPWLSIVKDARHQVGILATKLRLAPNSRVESKQVSAKGGRASPDDVLEQLRQMRAKREAE